MADWHAWHRAYDDPESGLSWRLAAVRRHVAAFLDERPGPVRIVSACAGDGRDVLGVLAERTDAGRVEVTLLETHPGLAEAARAAASSVPGARVDVRVVDAGSTDSYRDLPPADLLLLCGIFGNIVAADIAATIEQARGLCSPGALVLWTRGRGEPHDDIDAEIRAWFAAAGYDEVAHETLERGHRPTVGAHRYAGPRRELEAGRRLFTFLP